MTPVLTLAMADRGDAMDLVVAEANAAATLDLAHSVRPCQPVSFPGDAITFFVGGSRR